MAAPAPALAHGIGDLCRGDAGKWTVERCSTRSIEEADAAVGNSLYCFADDRGKVRKDGDNDI